MADFSAVSRAKDTDRLLAGPGLTCYQVRSAVGSRSNQPAPLRDAEAARVFASFSGQIQLFGETVSRNCCQLSCWPHLSRCSDDLACSISSAPILSIELDRSEVGGVALHAPVLRSVGLGNACRLLASVEPVLHQRR